MPPHPHSHPHHFHQQLLLHLKPKPRLPTINKLPRASHIHTNVSNTTTTRSRPALQSAPRNSATGVIFTATTVFPPHRGTSTAIPISQNYRHSRRVPQPPQPGLRSTPLSHQNHNSNYRQTHLRVTSAIHTKLPLSPSLQQQRGIHISTPKGKENHKHNDNHTRKMSDSAAELIGGPAQPQEKRRPTPVKLTGKKELIEEFLDRFDVFLFDCDGVLWQGNKLLPRIVETLDMLRSKGKQIVFVTNNSTKSRAAYQKKLAGMGIPAAIDEIFGSAYSSAIYISRVLQLPPTKKVYVIGETGMEDELRSEGISFFGGTDPSENVPMSPSDYTTFGPDPDVGVVLCGLDHNINYRKLAKAYQYLQSPECLFLATNVDSTFPTEGKLFPGAGSVSAPLAFMLGRRPLSSGKPSQAMMEAIEGRFRFDKKRTCMVGDRLDTDIRFGIEGGLGGTLAVLTGVSKEAEFMAEDAPVRPDAYLDMLADLLG